MQRPGVASPERWVGHNNAVVPVPPPRTADDDHGASLPGPRPGQPGRPLDVDLTSRLLEAATDLIAEDGWSAFNADRLVAQTQSGKAGVYRRWPRMIDLAAEVVGGLQLLDPLPERGALAEDLLAFHQPLVRPLSRDARALASLLGATHQHPDLAAAVHAALWAPLREAVHALLRRRAGHPPGSDGDRLTGLSTSLWCRYLVLGTPLPAGELRALFADARAA